MTTSERAVTEEACVEEYLADLESQFVNNEVDWLIPLGDNWLLAWAWAARLTRDHGIDAHVAMRVVRDLYPFGRGITVPPEWE